MVRGFLQVSQQWEVSGGLKGMMVPMGFYQHLGNHHNVRWRGELRVGSGQLPRDLLMTVASVKSQSLFHLRPHGKTWSTVGCVGKRMSS